MKRFFYTDALAAAWMAKHFGMRVFWNDWTGSATGDLPLEFDDLVSEIQNGFIRQFYVHPDSLHLLRPRVGDLGLDEIGAIVDLVEGTADGGWFKVDGDGTGRHEEGEARIIQRNGLAFHWPESEDA